MQDEHDAIVELLLGRRIVSVDMCNRQLILDNLTCVQVIPNEGVCSCGGGDYELTSLATVDNIITDVKCVNDPASDDGDGTGYSIFVFADNQKINVMQVDGNDGNGYYGSGYSLVVTRPKTYHITEHP